MPWTTTGARCVIGAAIASTACGLFAADPFPSAALPGTSLNQLIPNYEPSDLVWHSRLGRLFSVSDGSSTVSSRVFSIADNGTGPAFWPVAGDLEGICVADPVSDFLYVGTEQPNQIKEFRISTGLVTRTFDLDPWMTGAPGQGLEALTFVPDLGSAKLLKQIALTALQAKVQTGDEDGPPDRTQPRRARPSPRSVRSIRLQAAATFRAWTTIVQPACSTRSTMAPT